MRILMLTNHLNPGGITRYVYNLAEGLSAQGHRVTVASSGGSWESRLIEAGVNCLSLPLDAKSMIAPKLLLAWAGLIRHLGRHPADVVHANTRTTQFLAHLLWVFRKIPYVSTFHGFYRPHFLRRRFPCEGLRAIAISRSVSAFMTRDLGIAEDRIRVVHHGVNPGEFERGEPVESARRRLGIQGHPVIGMVSRFAPEKNHAVVFEAFALLLKEFPDACLVLLGSGRLRDLFEQRALETGIRSRVAFLKDMKSAEIFPCLDIYVQPSLEEGFGIAVLEAFFWGIPVVVSPAGGLAEIVEDGRTGLVLKDARDGRELSALLARLASDPALAKKLAEEARRNAAEKFTLERSLRETVRVYEEARAAGR
ncbi:MAG: glycosyltransferase family 4 protein [Candidatus Omnitrophica bacterium]|nr:glycosyltransferase family 4 protein [Candidatus Omnitrophota bacterium]